VDIVRRVQKAFRRYGGTQEPQIGRRRVELRIVNDKQDVRFYYAAGKGQARFGFFRCRPLGD